MDVKFFDSLYEGDSANGAKLCLGLTGGEFWARPAGCHTVYRGQDGDLDYDNVIGVMNLADADVTLALQALPANTIWYYIRRQISDCGKESTDSPLCVVRIDADGDMMADAPNAPINLEAEPIAGAKFTLRWRYSAIGQEISPLGFYVYVDTGSGFDFDTPDDIVVYSEGTIEYLWNSQAYTNGLLYSFCVRSYTLASGETQNTNYVSAVADSVGPDAITGLAVDWEEI